MQLACEQALGLGFFSWWGERVGQGIIIIIIIIFMMKGTIRVLRVNRLNKLGIYHI